MTVLIIVRQIHLLEMKVVKTKYKDEEYSLTISLACEIHQWNPLARLFLKSEKDISFFDGIWNRTSLTLLFQELEVIDQQIKSEHLIDEIQFN